MKTVYELDTEKKLLKCPRCQTQIITDRLHRMCKNCKKAVYRMAESSKPKRVYRVSFDDVRF
mgnify:FL=1